MREKTEADKKKEAKSKDRPIFNYVDPKTKTVKLPDEFSAALKKKYIEWIVTAKREETRAARVKKSIERLSKQF